MGKLSAPDHDLIALYSYEDDGTLIAEPVTSAQSIADVVRMIAVDDLQHGRPCFVARINVAEKRSYDISAEVAQAVIEYARSEGISLSAAAFDFAEDHGAAMPMWANGVEDGLFSAYEPEEA